MRNLLVIGIGAGNPDHLTIEAVRALNRVDTFVLVDKGEDKRALNGLRVEILARHLDPARSPRFLEIVDPRRDRTASDYGPAVDRWRAARLAQYEGVIGALAEDETGAFLVWGDPALYDGTILLLDEVAARGNVAFDLEVIPGISSIAALAARHRVPLNHVGESIQITTGRRLAESGMPEADNVVVMLDGAQAFLGVDDDVDIWWGAYLGTEDEVLVSGPLRDCGDEIARVRAEARARIGWMFDTYLLRRRRHS